MALYSYCSPPSRPRACSARRRRRPTRSPRRPRRACPRRWRRLIFSFFISAHADGSDRIGAWAPGRSRRGASLGRPQVDAGPRRSPSTCSEKVAKNRPMAPPRDSCSALCRTKHSHSQAMTVWPWPCIVMAYVVAASVVMATERQLQRVVPHEALALVAANRVVLHVAL